MNKPVLIFGIGQFGCTVAENLARTFSHKKQLNIFAVDTDQRDIETISDAKAISMAHDCNISDILDRVDTKILSTWFPCNRENDHVEYFECMGMNTGSNQWRMKALLAFNYFLSDPEKKESFHNYIDSAINSYENCNSVDIYIISSLAGGTGAGLFLPIDLYIKRYLAELGISDIKASAILALPEVCEELLTFEQQIKARANAYASIAELNAINITADGKDVGIDIKIGHEDDPYFGLLYNNRDEYFQSQDARPFDKIYIFRRIPGIKNVYSHANTLAEGINALLDEEPIFPTLSTAETLYGGFSLSKAVYSEQSILSYIASKTLCNAVTDEWTYLYDETTKELNKMRHIAYTQRRHFTESAENIVEAMEIAINNIYTNDELEAFSALLKRRYEIPANDTAPAENTVEKYLKPVLFKDFDDEFECIATTELNELLSTEDEVEDEYFFDENGEEIPCPKKTKKKKKPVHIPFISSFKQKKTSISLAQAAGELIDDYYRHGLEIINGDKEEFKNRIYNGNSKASITECILKNNGEAVHPLYALVCLCQTYKALLDRLTRFKTNEWEYMERNYPDPTVSKKISNTERKELIDKKSVVDYVTTPQKIKNDEKFAISTVDLSYIPRWLVGADKKVTMKCKYSSENPNRLLKVLQGDYSTIGSKPADEKMLRYDLAVTYDKIKTAFRTARMEQYLELVSQLIVSYFNLFKLLAKEKSDLQTTSVLVSRMHTKDAGFTYYLGAAETEKKFIFDCYQTYLIRSGKESELSSTLDRAFGQYIIDHPDMMVDIEKKYESDYEFFKPMFDNLNKAMFERLKESDFYKTDVRKNSLEALMTQNDKHGGDTNETALTKTLLAKTPPVRYNIPDFKDEYPVLMAMKHRVVALLPTEVDQYIKNNPDIFAGKSAKTVMETLFFMAGESYGDSSFRDYIPTNELHIFREVLGIKLSFIDELNKRSDNPLYVKAYRKAFALMEEQFTELWNPHLVCTINSDCLPEIE